MDNFDFVPIFCRFFNFYTKYLANCINNNLPVVSFSEWLDKYLD